MINRHIYYARLGITLCAIGLANGHAMAEVTFNFGPTDQGYMSNRVIQGQFLNPTIQTPFLLQDVAVSTGFGTQFIQLPEVVTIDGISYYHLVVGDPNSDFVQETFIHRGFGGFPNGQVGSASVGGQGNASDPLGSLSGTGSGTPTRVMVKQVVKDTDLVMTFTKGSLDKKPIITQELNSANIRVFTDLDMSNSGYSDATTAGIMTNIVELKTNQPGQQGDFDMAKDKQNSVVTAGRYTYTNGTGPGGSGGTYNYADGDANPSGVSWESFVEDRPDNVWAIPTNHPFPP